MDILSIVPLASKSLISSTDKLKPFCRTIPTLGTFCRRIPTLGMSRRGKSAMPAMSMSSTVSDESVQRRTGGYHPNLWNDDIMHFLSTPYGVIRFNFVLLHNPSTFRIYTLIFSSNLPYFMDMVRNLLTGNGLRD